MSKTFDAVERPQHYTDKQIEVIDYIKDTLSPQQFEGFCLGNALKYISRAGKKGDKKQDLKKAVWYLKKAIQEEEQDG